MFFIKRPALKGRIVFECLKFSCMFGISPCVGSPTALFMGLIGWLYDYPGHTIPLCLLPSTVDSLAEVITFSERKLRFMKTVSVFMKTQRKCGKKERTSNNLVYN